ncbi:TIGR03086 family protein [Spiractinospora alimapuensis]|uniref:TIGR03086 family metal-binding protein n=1 Tax=Spiractinospora alimapuensis TaxID=2820884 RepID=UPI001F39E27F|nr:TIGR03086 family metal-binding protein [Spiractinospora alimapuensis]QVQ51967.1 TIGR03086 family protein [Spiractinospora alimapuensis]
MATGRTVGPADGPALLRCSLTYALGSLSFAAEVDLRCPTPCAEWNLGALVDHMRDSNDALREAVAFGDVPIAPTRPTNESVRSVQALRAELHRLRAAWEDPLPPEEIHVEGLPLSLGVAALAGALEIAVHAWDIGQSCHHPNPVPTRLADALLSVAPLLIPETDRPGLFDPPLPVASSAPANDRLLAFLGRCPERPVAVA